MKELVILRGLPGSGKSTFARLLTLGRNGAIIENDQFMYENGLYIWKPSKLKSAVKHTNETLYKALKEELEIIVISNVNARPSDFEHYAEMGRKSGYKVSTIIVENRCNTKSRHNVEETTLKNMENNFDVKLI